MKEIIKDIEKQILNKKDKTYNNYFETKNNFYKSDNKYKSNNEGNYKKNINNEKDNRNINNKYKIPRFNQTWKFNPIGKYEYLDKEYDLYTTKQFEENKDFW